MPGARPGGLRGHPEAGHTAASLLASVLRQGLEVGVDTHDAVNRDPGGEDVGDGGHRLQEQSLTQRPPLLMLEPDLVGGVEHGHLGHDEAEGGPGHPR